MDSFINVYKQARASIHLLKKVPRTSNHSNSSTLLSNMFSHVFPYLTWKKQRVISTTERKSRTHATANVIWLYVSRAGIFASLLAQNSSASFPSRHQAFQWGWIYLERKAFISGARSCCVAPGIGHSHPSCQGSIAWIDLFSEAALHNCPITS